ncbi:MAG: exodeoxyribonuclease VII large subunit [Candidatus Krumholzibacteriota bacterium]|nr:exodeoxyribonuclease VII large subunit [Candidatus Krumholzibacteriota bacterium]
MKLDREGSIITAEDDIYTVSEINEALRQNLESEFPSVNIIGEIANFKAHSSGHFYFTLRDEKSLIPAVLFRNYVNNISFGPDNGMMVYVRGRITHFPPRGMTELIAYYMEPAGSGELELRMRQLLRKLDREGILDLDRKRSIPPYPERIAVITSATGSVIKDITNTLDRRWPVAEIIHIHADVGGQEAVRSISDAFDKLNNLDNIDLIILARGGGSIEDLWTFNTEAIAREIIKSKYPVITGIGHETDTTVADYVADLRAATPTAAAELSVPSSKEVLDKITVQIRKLRNLCLQESRRRIHLVDYLLESSVFPAVKYRIERFGLSVDDKTERLEQWWKWNMKMKLDDMKKFVQAAERSVNQKNNFYRRDFNRLSESLFTNNPKYLVKSSIETMKRLIHIIRFQVERDLDYSMKEFKGMLRSLKNLNPENVLKKGYAICTKKDGDEIVKNVNAVDEGDSLQVNFYRGNIECLVKSKKGEGKWRRKI